MGTVKAIDGTEIANDDRPSAEEAKEAIKILLRYIGEDPARAGLLETPDRVVRAYGEFFRGYDEDPAKILDKTFEDIEGYNDFVLVKNIDFISHCEHHMVPIEGHAHVAYWPGENVVGISKLARIVDVFARRLISQEKMTLQILRAIDEHLAPKGTAVIIDAAHNCMSCRGVFKKDSTTVTSMFSGIFEQDEKVRDRLLQSCYQRIK